MSGISINKAPLMTAHVVGELRAFEKEPLTIVDVGARGGINEEWRVFGDQLRMFCFEPDEEECKRLEAQAVPQLKFIPTALGGASGTATLYETRLPWSTGLYKSDMGYFGRFLNRDNGEVVAEHRIAVRSLDEVAQAYEMGQIDFLKLDAEGAELDVLAGGKTVLGTAGVLGILSEIRFHREINGSPSFAELDLFLRDHGFSIYGISANNLSRRALPYPQRGDYRLDSGKRFFAYTTHGQVQDGDALYFRDLLVARNEARLQAASAIAVLKLCCLMEIYSLADCAGELIVSQRQKLQGIADPDKLLDLLASGMAGTSAQYASYMQSYFAEPDPTPAPMPPPPAGLLSLIRRLLGR